MTRERTNCYEGMYIINSSLTDDARHKVIEKITASIEEKQGKIHKMFDQGRRRLAYEINKKREGHYIVLYFSVPTHHIPKLWRECRLNEDILRFMTLQASAVPDKIQFPLLPES